MFITWNADSNAAGELSTESLATTNCSAMMYTSFGFSRLPIVTIFGSGSLIS